MKRIVVVFWCLCVLLCGCTIKENQTGKTGSSSDETKHEAQILAMDTYMTLTAYGEHGGEAVEKAKKEIERLDALHSVSSKEGEVYIVNENGSEVLSEDTSSLLEASMEIYEKTGGLFDITIFPLMKEWGFTDENYKVPEKSRMEALLKNVDMSKLIYDKENRQVTLPEGVQIDFGGIAKGYTSARVMEIFKECGVESGIVSLGGNVQT